MNAVRNSGSWSNWDSLLYWFKGIRHQPHKKQILVQLINAFIFARSYVRLDDCKAHSFSLNQALAKVHKIRSGQRLLEELLVLIFFCLGQDFQILFLLGCQVSGMFLREWCMKRKFKSFWELWCCKSMLLNRSVLRIYCLYWCHWAKEYSFLLVILSFPPSAFSVLDKRDNHKRLLLSNIRIIRIVNSWIWLHLDYVSVRSFRQQFLGFSDRFSFYLKIGTNHIELFY